MPNVNIIGAGRVGRTLLRLLGTNVQELASTRIETARVAVAETGFGNAVPLSEMSSADIWLITVPDDQIFKAAEALSQSDVRPAIAIHCSGFHSAEAMSPLREKGWTLASAHPNLSFANPNEALERFAGCYVGIEGDEAAVNSADQLFASLGARTFPISSEDKVLYHAAAVVSNNFTTVLQALAHQIWAEAGVPRDVAEALGTDLLSSATRNIAQLGPAKALTGPAARGDQGVIVAERQALANWDAAVGELYGELSTMAARLKQDGVPVNRRGEGEY